MGKDAIHHPGHTVEQVADWYDYYFADIGDRGGSPGDWIWSTVEIDGVTHRCILMIVPLVGLKPAERSRVGQRGGELARIFPSHQPNPRGWADPGPITGWDGDEYNPTLSPSIFIRGASKVKGWHGFFQRGEMVNLDGSIAGIAANG